MAGFGNFVWLFCAVTCFIALNLSITSAKKRINEPALEIDVTLTAADPSQIQVFILENSPEDTLVGVISVNSPEEEVTCEGVSQSHFKLEQMSAVTYLLLTGQVPLDREEVASVNFSIVCSDGERNSISTLGPIYVTDLNDNVPEITIADHEIHVQENLPRNTALTYVQVTDADEQSGAECSIDPIRAFWLQEMYGGGYIMNTNREFDREEMDHYTVNIICHDFGQPSYTSSLYVDVNIDDANDNSPVIAVDSVVNITENSAAGAYVTHISVSDADVGEAGESSCEVNDSTFLIENIYPQNHVLLTTQSLDREERSNYYVIVTCRDHGEPRRETRVPVSVIIEDVNDNMPIIYAEDSVTMVENSPSGTYVTYVMVTDADAGEAGRVNCRISSGLVALSAEGYGVYTIQTAKALDREMTPELSFEISCEDHGDPFLLTTRDFIIYLEDVNDNGPIFHRSAYMIVISEDTTTDEVIVQTLASDPDEGENARTVYAIYMYTPNEENDFIRRYFTIDPETAEIRLLHTLSSEELRDLRDVQFYVEATDAAEPSFVSTARVGVNVLTDTQKHYLHKT